MTDTTPPEARPEYDQLVSNLRTLAQRQDAIQKTEQRRVAVAGVMRKAAEAFAAGQLSPHELVRLHALRLRLDGGLLPEEQV